MKHAVLPIVEVRSPRQLSMALDTMQISGLSALDRQAVISRLDSSADGGERRRARGGSR